MKKDNTDPGLLFNLNFARTRDLFIELQWHFTHFIDVFLIYLFFDSFHMCVLLKQARETSEEGYLEKDKRVDSFCGEILL